MWDITKIHKSSDKIGILVPYFGAEQKYILCDKASKVVDHCTQHEQNHGFISDISLQTYKIYDNMDINATFWHSAIIYFACINSL